MREVTGQAGGRGPGHTGLAHSQGAERFSYSPNTPASIPSPASIRRHPVRSQAHSESGSRASSPLAAPRKSRSAWTHRHSSQPLCVCLKGPTSPPLKVLLRQGSHAWAGLIAKGPSDLVTGDPAPGRGGGGTPRGRSGGGRDAGSGPRGVGTGRRARVRGGTTPWLKALISQAAAPAATLLPRSDVPVATSAVPATAAASPGRPHGSGAGVPSASVRHLWEWAAS